MSAATAAFPGSLHDPHPQPLPTRGRGGEEFVAPRLGWRNHPDDRPATRFKDIGLVRSLTHIELMRSTGRRPPRCVDRPSCRRPKTCTLIYSVKARRPQTRVGTSGIACVTDNTCAETRLAISVTGRGRGDGRGAQLTPSTG